MHAQKIHDMKTSLFVVTETEKHKSEDPTCCVVGVYSTIELAQKAMVMAIKEMIDCYPEAHFSQEAMDGGLILKDENIGAFCYNIISRVLDEVN